MVLWFLGGGLMETFECVVNVDDHLQVHTFVAIIPVQIDTKVTCALPIMGDRVIFLEGVHEMLGMFLSDIFYAEIIHAEGEDNGMPFVRP